MFPPVVTEWVDKQTAVPRLGRILRQLWDVTGEDGQLKGRKSQSRKAYC